MLHNCEKDVLLIQDYAGIFGGPIPMEVSKMFGISFDRISLWNSKQINMDDPLFNLTWVKDKRLKTYVKMIEDKIKNS